MSHLHTNGELYQHIINLHINMLYKMYTQNIFIVSVQIIEIGLPCLKVEFHGKRYNQTAVFPY